MATPSERLRDELVQRRPFATPGREGVVALFLTADRLHRHLEGLVEPLGITLAQYNVLRILRGAGAEGLCTLEIARRLIERAPGITRLIDRLEAAGLVRRERSTTDRRQVWCRITPKGEALVGKASAVVDAADDAALRGFTRAEAAALVGYLDRIRQTIPDK